MKSVSSCVSRRKNLFWRLSGCGFPAGLAGMLDYSSRERMEETLKSATEIFKESLASAVQSRLKGKTPEGLGNAVSADSLLRAQIEKNIMG